LQGVEHLERAADGTVRVSPDAVRFRLQFPDDYCRSVQPDLQFRVASVHTPLVHPNCRGGILCLGPHFRPATRIRPLVEHVYRIITGKTIAPDHAFDADAARYYLAHLGQVQALRAQPLWSRPVARRARVTRAAARPGAGGGQP
jgi:hypothetical protein